MTYCGASYRKADLQVHSPRDNAWDGDRPETNSASSDDAEIATARANWSRDFIDACVERGLEVVALTDHHEGVYCWRVIDELTRLRAGGNTVQLWVLPGMELTAKDSAQALILFDQALPRALFEKARSILHLPSDCKEDSPTGIQVELLDHNIAELQQLLDADDELRGRFIILPNVTPGGHKTVLRSGFHKRFREMPYVGGYLDKKYPDDLEDGDLRILQGEIPAWTSERRGVVATSDARHADFRSLGAFATWVKMAEPTAESLRQAMLAADSRILYEEFSPPAVYIADITVSNADFLCVGDLELSPQLNAVIGGRGAGKSTLLEFFRFALGQSALDLPQSEWDPTHGRRKDILLEALGPNGAVSVTVLINGARIRLRRARSTHDHIAWEVDGESRAVTAADVRKHVPAQTYSQGELSHLGHASADRRLMELVVEPARDELTANRGELEQVGNGLASALQAAVAMWTAEQDLRRVETEIATLDAQIAALREQLSKGPQEAQRVADAHAGFMATSSWFDAAEKARQEAAALVGEGLADGARRLDGTLKDATALNEDATGLARSALERFREALRSAGSLVSSADAALKDELASEALVWQEKRAAHDIEYDHALQQLAGQRSSAEALARVTEVLAEKRLARDGVAGRIAQLKPEAIKIDDLRKTSVELQARRRAITADQVKYVEEASGGLASAEMDKVGDLGQLRDAISALFTGTSVREQRLVELLTHIADADEPINAWWSLIVEVLEILQWKSRGLRDTDVRPSAPILDRAIDAGGLERFCDRLTPERVVQALKAVIDPKIRVLYRRGTKQIEFRRASQGEKAATLLTILMNQDGGPLLIDQPEEDLDNRIIGEIVAATRNAKRRRQILFATHNANLVVNGDSELVLDLAAGGVTCQGAIDSPQVRDAITDTMEGGRTAFELRRRKYNF